MAPGCCGSFCLTIVSLLTIGSTLALAICMYILMSRIKLQDADNQLIVFVIIFLCLTALVLIFAIYSSACGNNCTRSVVIGIYIVYDLFLIAIGVLTFVARNQVVGKFQTIWTSNTTAAITEIQKVLNCCGFDNNTGCPSNSTLCKTKISDYYGQYAYWIGGVSIGLAVLLLICIIFACKIVCCSEAGYKQLNTTPVQYGLWA